MVFDDIPSRSRRAVLGAALAGAAALFAHALGRGGRRWPAANGDNLHLGEGLDVQRGNGGHRADPRQLDR